MNMYNGLPSTIDVDGISYAIITDFKAVLEWHRKRRNPYLTSEEKAFATVRLFCIEIPDNWALAFYRIMEFVWGGEIPDEVPGDGVESMDFQQDYERLWAAFYKTYNGLNINHIDMHWWEFKALLNELPDDTEFKQVIRIRQMKPDPKDPEQAFKIMEMQEHYALKEVEYGIRAV